MRSAAIFSFVTAGSGEAAARAVRTNAGATSGAAATASDFDRNNLRLMGGVIGVGVAAG